MLNLLSNHNLVITRSRHILTQAQQEAYNAQGYLLVSGLIALGVARAAEIAMRRLIGIDSQNPASWEGFKQGHQPFDDPALLACYTPEFCAAAQLADDYPAFLKPPRQAYAINVFPRPGEWHWPHPHIDHALKDSGYHVFPRAFRIAAMTYLSDVPPHGGGTVVWPGSHQKLEDVAHADPARFELMWALNQELPKLDLGEPVELTPRCGDVLFYHYLCAHGGSMNTSDQPRLALNMKW